MGLNLKYESETEHNPTDVILPLGGGWYIVQWLCRGLSAADGAEFWEVIHTPYGEDETHFSMSHRRPSESCVTCGVKVPDTVIGYFSLCSNTNIGR